MNKTLALANRSLKEVLRDFINVFFGIAFPILLLGMLTLIQKNTHEKVFQIINLTPGIAVFGLSFVSLFCGMLIARDRKSSFITRLYTSPLSSKNFILGYALPFIPFSIVQIILCYLFAVFLGLDATVNLLMSILVIIPSSFLFIAIGLMCGSIFNDKQVGGICGALLTNFTAFLSGTWIRLEIMGKGFRTFANLLPFSHAVTAGRLAINGNYIDTIPHLIWVISYSIALTIIAIIIFNKQMTSDKA